MANFFEHKDRRMIPNWRSFDKSTKLGELNSFQADRPTRAEEMSIEDYIFDWKSNNDIAHAADLISAAIVNGLQNNSSVIEAANFILANEKYGTFSQISLANKIINQKKEVDFTSQFSSLTFDVLHNLVNEKIVWGKINETRKLISHYPYNAILYVELSRLYSILGLEEKAVKAMKTSLHLSSNNRFILRSATRLFVHYQNSQRGYLNYIHNILQKSPLTTLDPWLTSAEISISTIKNQTSKNIKKGIELINSNNISPFNFTELASSIATVELKTGSIKKSREFFKKALISPNDNSLAQIEWASKKDSQLHINPATFSVRMNFEALALDNFHNDKFDLALDNAARWFADMPFSKRPVIFGSMLASSILKDQSKAISFLEAGLMSHHNDPLLINNLAYSLAMDNKGKEAIEYLDKIKKDAPIDTATEICLMATRGLALFRTGFPDHGRKFYIAAIEKTRNFNDPNLNWTAILNYTREEIRIRSEYAEQLMNYVNRIPTNNDDITIRILHQEVLDMYEDFKSNHNKE